MGESAAVLLTFIPRGEGSGEVDKTTPAWRRAMSTVTRETKKSYADFPAFAGRLLDARNRNWIPKIERYLRSGDTYFVVVGAAHLGGPNGLLALLRARGCRLE